MEIAFARSATRHRIPRRDSLRVVLEADGWVEIPPPSDGHHKSARRLYVGPGSSGMIEVVAVEREDGVLVIIHAMRLRERTRRLWERGRK